MASFDEDKKKVCFRVVFQATPDFRASKSVYRAPDKWRPTFGRAGRVVFDWFDHQSSSITIVEIASLLLHRRFYPKHILPFYRNSRLKNQNIDKWSNFLKYAKSKHGKTSYDVWPWLPNGSVKNLVTWSVDKNQPMKLSHYRALGPIHIERVMKLAKNRGFV